MQADQYCRDKIAKPGSSYYYSLLYTPKNKVADVTAIYAYQEEITQSVLHCGDREIAQTKLNWWAEELQRCFNQKPQHPVSHALQAAIRNYMLPIEYFEELLDGARMRLAHDIYNSYDQMKLDCYRLGGAPSLLVTEILGYNDRSTQRFSEDLGIALQLTDNIHRLRMNTLQGNICIPLDEMQAHNIQPDDVLKKETPEKMKNLLTTQGQRARAHFKQAASHLLASEQRSQLPRIILGNLQIALLDTIESDGFRLTEHQVDLTPLRKFWIAWRTQLNPGHRLFQ
ncbi:MAG: squalene/phytoene synthase family protein [Gammaproteobacteria bacterium]